MVVGMGVVGAPSASAGDNTAIVMIERIEVQDSTAVLALRLGADAPPAMSGQDWTVTVKVETAPGVWKVKSTGEWASPDVWGYLPDGSYGPLWYKDRNYELPYSEPFVPVTVGANHKVEALVKYASSDPYTPEIFSTESMVFEADLPYVTVPDLEWPSVDTKQCANASMTLGGFVGDTSVSWPPSPYATVESNVGVYNLSYAVPTTSFSVCPKMNSDDERTVTGTITANGADIDKLEFTEPFTIRQIPATITRAATLSQDGMLNGRVTAKTAPVPGVKLTVYTVSNNVLATYSTPVTASDGSFSTFISPSIRAFPLIVDFPGTFTVADEVTEPFVLPDAPPPPACDPAYPDFCIPPPPPYLNCSDFVEKNFTALAPDPHGLDGDEDGIACEEAVTPPAALPPNAPEATITAVTSSAITMDWAVPTAPNGTIAAYQFGWLSASGKPVPAWDGEYAVAAASDPFVFTNLAPDTEYKVWVRARNETGYGEKQWITKKTAAAPVVTPPPVTTPPVPTVAVYTKAVSRGGKLYVNVDPDKGRGYWKFKVQRLKGDVWKHYKTYKTYGKKETRTLNLKKGTYRVVVTGKYGYQGATSTPVYLKK